MAISQKLMMRQGQSLVMTPQLLQAIKLLQFSSAELTAFLQEEMERNPLLESEGHSDAGEPVAAERVREEFLRGERRRAHRRRLGQGLSIHRRGRIRREPRLRRLERLRLGRAGAHPKRSCERRGRRRALRLLLDRHAWRQRLLGRRDAEPRGLCRIDEEPARNARGAALAGLRGSASTYDRPRADRCDR